MRQISPGGNHRIESMKQETIYDPKHVITKRPVQVIHGKEQGELTCTGILELSLELK
jgi:hypothetical protein